MSYNMPPKKKNSLYFALFLHLLFSSLCTTQVHHNSSRPTSWRGGDTRDRLTSETRILSLTPVDHHQPHQNSAWMTWTSDAQMVQQRRSTITNAATTSKHVNNHNRMFASRVESLRSSQFPLMQLSGSTTERYTK